ncbi:unnamed protein product [Lactuca virosa]|uniref:F-box domain-containing protein n=1 Tax=Lactuca virosa TaxID=75947 RepID=A0AAU9LQ61_9ASTR|nr:unnamed protein product [Lactuca virosa]
MQFDHDNVRRVVEQDRLSRLPDELIHKIMSGFDMKFVVETCLMSSRWKHLWTSMPFLNFSSCQFGSLLRFAEFMTHVLSHRNHQTEVSLLKLHFQGAANDFFVRKIANYVFSHNVQELTMWLGHNLPNNPPLLFSSNSLKHFTLTSVVIGACNITPKTPWDFPALTTLHLSGIVLSGDLFSKCVNVKNLTLESFGIVDVEEFDIITPRLSNLMLIGGKCSRVIINLIAPQLENLTIYHCIIRLLNAPSILSSLCYTGFPHPQLFKDCFRSLNEVPICWLKMPYKEEDALKTIHMLQKLRSARYLTLDAYIVEIL